MANSFFKFKQFTIQQEGAGMKVTTEACLFGALAVSDNPLAILDAGSGTGLLSLMLAQRFPQAIITAVDIDPIAASLTQFNFKNSVFKDILQFKLLDYGNLNETLKFDAIVCNPPFYKSGFHSQNHQRNKAMRDEVNLLNVVKLFSKNLTLNGQAWILLPPYELSVFEVLANEQHLFCTQKIHVENKTGKLFRIISKFEKTKQACEEKYLCISSNEGSYTAEFRNLLKDFYLAF